MNYMRRACFHLSWKEKCHNLWLTTEVNVFIYIFCFIFFFVKHFLSAFMLLYAERQNDYNLEKKKTQLFFGIDIKIE